MRRRHALSLAVGFFLLLALAGLTSSSQNEKSRGNFQPDITKTWDDAAMATLEVPLADPIGSPKQVPASYYYKIPVRPIYKSYPVYAPGHEPPGYMEWLKQREPVIVWGGKGHKPPLSTEADWVKAGEIVFGSPIHLNGHLVVTLAEVRDPAWYQKVDTPVARNGTMPFARYFIRRKGEIELGALSCATCHTRVMPDGSILKGAQGSFPFDRSMAYTYRSLVASAKDPAPALSLIRSNERFLYAVPWLRPEPLADLNRMSVGEIASPHEAIPPGVLDRHGSSPYYPLQIPDLIGVKDRHYLDHTGLQQQRSIVDLMRYAALNQGGDDIADFDGFIPADFGNFRKLPEPGDPNRLGGRYSDEQLYALALYVYSLKPPPNPNKFDALAARGKKVFEREGCAGCHTPPLYTNNKLTLAEGFTPPPGAAEKYDILPVSVGTDPGLATKTRRGTGYYKVPSLKGVWYRSMFGHSGWCATIEDWFDPRRTRDDYVPTGFKPYGAKTNAVKGHPFGLDLNAEDKKALIAFLKTL